jgi:hypothetical protein
MSALKAELRPVVIERPDATPCRLAMTLVAGLPKPPLVRIARLVAIEAASGRVAEFCHLRVTLAAPHGPVGVPQLEIRRCVIEGLAVELDDVGIPPHVIRMTMGAFLCPCIRLAPVESPARQPVRGYFFVARKTETRLRLSRERFVTRAALLLELGMSGDERTGHNQVLERVLRPRRRYRRAGHNKPDDDPECMCAWPAQRQAPTQNKCAA